MVDTISNKRILKNTFFLYFRMFFLLVVGLYTSRVILIALGISDYGIYNVVGGFVTMFVFINNAMVNSTHRYVAYELGKSENRKMSLIFTTSLNIHVVISLIFIILSETIGLWFLFNKMVISTDRMNAAFWVFQFSVLSCITNIMSVPYNALIIAYEKMSAFAYISLLDGVLKLIIAYLISISFGDRLILYGGLIMLVTIINRVVCGLYCRQKFIETKYSFVVNKALMKEMTIFASWNLVGNFSYVCCTQGVNILLNLFFNPAVNAARGIAVQIQGVISNFSYNIENAIKPQITKSYAQNNLSRMHTLISLSARASYYVLLLVSIPLLLETEQILNLWLAEVPNHTCNFVRITIFIILVETVANPLLTASQATGEMKKYQMTVSVLCFLILPFSYLSLLLFKEPEIVFIIYLCVEILVQFVKLFIVGQQICLPISRYVKEVFVRCFFVTFFTLLVMIPFLFSLKDNFVRLIIVSIAGWGIVFLFSYGIGINAKERQILNKKIKSYIK